MCQFIKFRSCQIHIKVLRAVCSSCDERKVDVGGSCAGKLFFRFLCRFLQSLHCHLIAGQVNAFLSLEFADHPVNHFIVKIIAAKTGIAVCSKNLDYAVADFDDGNIEGTAAQVIYHDFLFFFVIKSISKCCCRRLIDNTFYIQARNLACILGSLTLCIVEISRYGNNRFIYFFTEVILCIRFQLLKNHSGNFLRGIFLSVNV